MKKRKLVWASIALCAVTLSACNNKEQATTNETVATSEKQQAGNLSKEEVLQKASEASQNIKSAEMTMDIKMDMKMNEQENKVDTTTVVQYTLDPFVMKTETSFPVDGQAQTMTSYMDKEAMYFQVPGSETWQKQPLDTAGVDVDSLIDTYSSSEIFDSFEEYQDKVEMTEAGDNYVLSFAGSGEELKDLAEKVLASGNTGAEADMSSMMEQMKINDFSYESIISKETFLPVSFTSTMDYEVESDGYKIAAKMDQTGTFDKINQVEPIELPNVAE